MEDKTNSNGTFNNIHKVIIIVLTLASLFVFYLSFKTSIMICGAEDINPGTGIWFAFVGLLLLSTTIVNIIYVIFHLFKKNSKFQYKIFLPLSVSALTILMDSVDLCIFIKL